MTPFEFPDVELWACGALRAALATEPEPWAPDVVVDIRRPAALPDRFVVLTADPGPMRLLDAQVNLRIRTWGPTESDASQLARTVRRLLTVAATGHGGISILPGGSLPAWVQDENDQPMRVQWLPLLVRAQDKE